MRKALQTILAILLSASCLASCSDGSTGETDTASIETNFTAAETETAGEAETEAETEGRELFLPEMIEPREALGGESLTIRFRKSDLTASGYNEAGEGAAFSLEKWVSSTPVSLEGCYGFYYNLPAHRLIQSIAFFDGDGVYLSGVGTDSFNQYGTSHSGFVTVPEDASSARFVNYLGTNILPQFDHAEVITFPTEEAYNDARELYPLCGVKIACLGDSLTEGDYGLPEGVGGRKFENYPYYLGRYTGASVTNFGRCGATSSSYLHDYYDTGLVDISDSDVILLMLGTNKGLAADTELYGDYAALVEGILADKKEGALLVLVTPPSATTDETKINCGYMDSVISARDGVVKIAREKALPLIDAYRNSPIQPDTEDIYQSLDGLHLTRDGYEAFARYIAGELLALIG